MMVVGAVALLSACASPLFTEYANSSQGKWRRCFWGIVGKMVAIGILVSCCLGGNLCDFVGTLAVSWSIMLLTCGYGDGRYVAKKFAASHFFALVLFACAGIIDEGHGGAVLYAVAFGMLLGSYPINSWTDSFFMRAPVFFLDVWLVVIRPVIVAFLLSTVGTGVILLAGGAARTISLVLAWGSLVIIPVLFFAKTELRRLIACMACWQSGYVWLFMAHFPVKNFDLIVLFAVTQGILLAIISNGVTYLYRRNRTDSIENLIGLFECDYFSSVFIMSSLMFLIAMPVIFLFKDDVAVRQNSLLYQIIGSMITPAAFFNRIYRMMKMQLPRGRGIKF
jgi:hypothetical protein